MFGAQRVILYEIGRERQADMNLCTQILAFIETPQYLRKRMFTLSPELKYTGILPPLQTPHHNVPRSIRQCKVGSLREGVTVGRHGDTLTLDVGLESTVQCEGDLPAGRRVTVRLKSLGANPTGKTVELSESPPAPGLEYWGYGVTKMRSLLELLQGNEFDLKIGTSRYGTSIVDVWPQLNASILNAKNILIAFGSPKLGLREILNQDHQAPEKVFDYFINTVPNQQVATVRTEEAVLVTLGLLNVGAHLR